MTCDANAWSAFQAGIALGFALGAAFVLLLVAIHRSGK